MKNIRQLVELNHVNNVIIRRIFVNQYKDDVRSSDNYFRYYPDDDSYDKTKGNTEKINAWLLSEGYEIESSDPCFHLLIRWDW